MGRALCDDSPTARTLFDSADRILGQPLSRLCFEGPADELTDTINAQPAILTASIAMLRTAYAAGAPRPDWVAGHSLGHFAALVAAAALSFEDALRLVRMRGEVTKAVAERTHGGMAAVLKLDTAVLEALCRQASAETGRYVGIANDNAPGQIVITGEMPALERAIELCKTAGAKRVVPLAVTGAFHSPIMTSAAQALERGMRDIPIQSPTVPIISNVTARPLTVPTEIRADILQQLTHPVRWTSSIETIAAEGGNTFVEIGPGEVLTGLIKRIVPEAQAWSLDTPDGISRLTA
jgi:[acyl-carrier-protein] S-malonyltransferase